MAKEIKILQVVGTMNRGGAETFLMNTLRAVDKSKIKMYFLCYGDENFDYESELKLLGGEVIRVPDVKSVGVVRHIKDIRAVIESRNIDVVHSHTYYNSVFSLFAAYISGVGSRIVHSHNTQSERDPSLVKRLYFIISRFSINILSTRKVACGKDPGKALFGKNKFGIINNGINVSAFHFNKTLRKQTRSELSIGDEETVILNIARFDEQKNHEFIIDIYAQYLLLNKKAKLLLVGDGSLFTVIKDKVERMKLVDSVLFLGKRSDVAAIYSASDLFLFPSLFEGLPVTLVEAQANGIPCLISNAIDKDIRVTKYIKFFSLKKSAASWAERMLAIDLTRDPNQSSLLGGPYDMKKNITSIEAMYIESVRSI